MPRELADACALTKQFLDIYVARCACLIQQTNKLNIYIEQNILLYNITKYSKSVKIQYDLI